MKDCRSCRNYLCSPLQEPCESCLWDVDEEPSNWEAPTNYDRLVSKAPEELAEYLANICYELWRLFSEDPEKVWLDWLKAPAEEEE